MWAVELPLGRLEASGAPDSLSLQAIPSHLSVAYCRWSSRTPSRCPRPAPPSDSQPINSEAMSNQSAVHPHFPEEIPSLLPPQIVSNAIKPSQPLYISPVNYRTWVKALFFLGRVKIADSSLGENLEHN